MDELLQRSLDEDLIDTFESATNYVKNEGPLLNLTENDMLYFYGRYKRVTEGACEAPKPSFFDLKAKRKWQAWMDCNDFEVEEAAVQYIEKLSEVNSEWDKETTKDSTRYWVSVSTMAKEPEDEKTDSEKNVFDWLKEDKIDKVKSYISEDPDCVLKKDNCGLNLIHWAADRGAKDIIEIIVNSTPGILDSVDEDGQTPLHYASSCGHLEIVEYLKGIGSNVHAKDNEGCTPIDVSFNEDIKNTLLS
ncbi:acyl-CoA-binding domain-containing protein 6 [Lepeophtheirus salmonis]|uniref:acyl-CoA-binding domain-containing protein 6 n=1 Tax=Lepeophtheirus salmonis TaxID=72036 RepID=UPI001AEB5665|nr:acyl-CoA-binding domain-containing protein 6-like [Lepeophtheirus salmonis]